MPQIIRKYRDLNLDLPIHPVTGDLISLKDDDAIKKAVQNIVLTTIYERHYDDIFGCEVYKALFEPLSYFTAINIQNSIERALTLFEPRIELISVIVDPSEEANGYTVTISFRMKNISQPLTIEFFLDRVR